MKIDLHRDTSVFDLLAAEWDGLLGLGHNKRRVSDP